MVLKQKDSFPIIPEEKVAHLRKHFDKKNTCSCGYEGLHELPIQGYGNHPGGWEISKGHYFWLFVICPNCDFAVSINKMGAPRERY